MISAFGVDHGGISKGIRLVRVPRGHEIHTGPYVPAAHGPAPGGKKPTRAQRHTQHPPGRKTGPQRVKGKLNRAGEAHVSVKGLGRGSGETLKGTGGFLERHPGVTGLAVLGGAGYGGYKYLEKNPPKKRKKSE